MKTTFFPFGCNYHGFYVQRDNSTKTETLTKKEIINKATPCMGSKTDHVNKIINSARQRNKTTFEILTSTGLLIINLK